MSEIAALTPPSLPALPMDAAAIRKVLPHRYPFLLIDRVTEIDPGKSLTAIKCVSQNEPYFQGHFPEYAVMPGVLQVEALAQAGAVLVLLMPEYRGKLAMLTGVDNFKFRRPVLPGDVLTLRVEEFRHRKGFGKARGVITADGDLCCEGEISFGLVDR